MFKKNLNPRVLIYSAYLIAFLLFFWILASSYLSGGYIIAGHDSGLPLNSWEFLKTRYYSWDERIGFGQDNSALYGSIILHSFDHIFAYLSGVSAAGNALAIAFWLSLIFISAFIFAWSVRDILGKYFVFLFPPLITINFYIFQSIFILERSKYELVAALLLFMAILFKIRSKQIGLIMGAVVAALIFTVFNGGGWIGLPLFGGTIIFTLTFLSLEIINGVLKFKLIAVFRILVFLCLTAVFFLLLNSYSIFPYFITFKLADASLLNDIGIRQAYIEWIGSLSHGASFLNLFRLQGVPDWYSNQYVLSVGHPFAQTYFENVYLVVVSFLFPILALLSFILAREKSQKRLVYYFGVMTLVGMFFTAGTHAPLGFIYEAIFNYVPGFVIFRSPYYKFGSLMFIGISVLMAFSISSLIKGVSSKFQNSKTKNLIAFSMAFLFLGLWLGYHYKLYHIDIFSWQKGFSSRIKLPSYVYDFNNYAQENISDERILLMPPLDHEWRNDGYNFGYWSLSTLPYSLSSKNFIVNGFGLNKEEGSWVNNLYTFFEEENETEFLSLAQKFNIKYILFRGDAVSYPKTFPDNPIEQYKKIADNFSGVKKVKNFGEWSLYKIIDEINTQVSLAGSIDLLSKDDANLSRNFLRHKTTVLYDKEDEISQNLMKMSNLKVFSLQCNTCVLETFEASNVLPEVTVMPNAFLYKFKVYRENKAIENAADDGSKISSYLAFILRRTAENFRMITFGIQDRYLISNIATINVYLDRVYGLITTSSDPVTDYTTAIGIMSGVTPVENNLRNYIGDQEFLIRSEELRSSILDTMMRIYKIKDYYRPLLKDVVGLRHEKRYLVRSFPRNSSVYLRKSTLPSDDKNLPVLPSAVTIQQGQNKAVLKTENNNDPEWLQFRIPAFGEGKGYISLKFDKILNLFMPLGGSIEISPSGEKACISGKIKYFDPFKVYEVNVQSLKNNQVLKLIFMDEELNEEFRFLVGRPETNIYPIVSYEPYRYVYHPDGRAKNPNVFVCSDNKEPPSVEKIEIFEINTPQIIVVQNEHRLDSQPPEIEVNKKDPTKYIVNVKDAKEPFILSLNQRYSPLWKITQNEPLLTQIKMALGNKSEQEHFVVNGYANGWIVDRKGDYSLTLEYVPQILFLIGLKITLISLGASLIYLGGMLYLKIRRNKKDVD